MHILILALLYTIVVFLTVLIIIIQLLTLFTTPTETPLAQEIFLKKPTDCIQAQGGNCTFTCQTRAGIEALLYYTPTQNNETFYSDLTHSPNNLTQEKLTIPAQLAYNETTVICDARNQNDNYVHKNTTAQLLVQGMI